MKAHKLCKLFPAITGQPLLDLIQDIKRNGLRQPITTYEGQILDGANRYAACQAAGIEPEMVEFTGEDPLAFVISQNMNRRHLTDDQRAAIATQIAKSKHGGDRGQGAESDPSENPITIAEAAALMKVSPRQVKIAKQVKKESPGAFEKVKTGEMTLNAAHEKKHPRKPRSPKPAPSPLKGVDISKLTPEEQVPDPSDPANHEPEPATPPPTPPAQSTTGPITLKEFQSILKSAEARANEAAAGNQQERDKYGKLANEMASRLLNPPQASYNPYVG